MKLTIVAATGGIGRHLLDQALAAGHEVTAVVRNARSLPGSVRVCTADLATAGPDDLVPAFAGADAVLSALGPRGGADFGITSKGTATIVEAARRAGVHRLVVVSAAPVGTVASPHNPDPPRYDPGDGFLMRHLLAPITKRVLRRHYADLAIAEDALRTSDLDWTIIRPPRLTDKPMTGKYRTATGRNVRGGVTIARADVAHLMLRAVDQHDSSRQIIAIAN